MLDNNILNLFMSSPDEAKRLLRAPGINDSIDSFGNSAVFYACKADQLYQPNSPATFLFNDILQREDLDLYKTNHAGQTVFHFADQEQKEAIIQEAIRRFPLDARDLKDKTYAFDDIAYIKNVTLSSTRPYVICHCSLNTVIAMLAVMPTYGGELIHAAKNSRIDIFIALLDKDKRCVKNINKVENDETTLSALISNNTGRLLQEAVDCVIKAGAAPGVNKQGFTELTIAYKKNHYAAVDAILNRQNPDKEKFLEAQLIKTDRAFQIDLKQALRIINSATYNILIASLQLWVHHLQNDENKDKIIDKLIELRHFKFLHFLFSKSSVTFSKSTMLIILNQINKSQNPIYAYFFTCDLLDAFGSQDSKELLRLAYETDNFYLAKALFTKWPRLSESKIWIDDEGKFFSSDLEFLIANKKFDIVWILVEKNPSCAVSEDLAKLVCGNIMHLTSALMKLRHIKDKIICSIFENENSQFFAIYKNKLSNYDLQYLRALYESLNISESSPLKPPPYQKPFNRSEFWRPTPPPTSNGLGSNLALVCMVDLEQKKDEDVNQCSRNGVNLK